MLKFKEETVNYTKYRFIWGCGGHTTSGYIHCNIYKENYILDLYKSIKTKLKGTNVKTKRRYSAKQVKELNEKLNLYIADQKEFLSLLQALPYFKDELVTMSELHTISDIANKHGKIGSPSTRTYRDVQDIIHHYEEVLEIIENDLESLVSIAV